MDKKYVYSIDEERYDSDMYDSLDECLAAILKEFAPGDMVYVGEAVLPDAERILSIALTMRDVEEEIAEYLSDNEGEYAEDNFSLTKEENLSLTKVIEDAVKKWVKDNNFTMGFYRVEDIDAYILHHDGSIRRK